MNNSKVRGAKGVGARCPICGAPAEPEVRPFCSKRCADVDLARWMNGVYVIPGHVDDDEDGDQARSGIVPLPGEGDTH